MEKLEKDISKNYQPLVMWVTDLAELMDLFIESNNVRFVADDVKYESIEEFVKESRGRKPSSVKIKGSNPYITLDFDSSSAHLYISPDSLAGSGLFHKVDSILSRCERKPRFLYRFLWAWAISAAYLLFYLPPFNQYFYLKDWVWAITFPWWCYVFYLNLFRHSVVMPIHKEERLSFFRRNIDGVIIAVIAAIVGVIGTKVEDRVWPRTPIPVNEKAGAHQTPPIVIQPASGTASSH